MSDSGTAANRTIANGTVPIRTDLNGTASNGNGTGANGSTAPNGQKASATKANLASLAHLHSAGQGYSAYRPENKRRGAISGPSASYRDGTFDDEAGTSENEEG